MIHKILGRLSSVRSFVFAALALAAFTVQAFDTPYLTFRSAASFSLTTVSTKRWDGTLQYSTDAANWTDVAASSTMTAVQSGSEYFLYLRGKDNTVVNAGSYNALFALTATEGVACEGDIETLRDYESDPLTISTMGASCYKYMFNEWTKLTSAPVLSARALSESCYESMFRGCSALKTPPELPVTTLANKCYNYMFRDCTSLISLPALPATEATEQCYFYMFNGCSSLKVNTAEPGVAWTIPSAVGSGASLWNSSMFAGTAGTFTGAPSPGVTYYVESALPPSLSLKTGADQLAAYVGETVNINLADTIKGGETPYTFALTADSTLPGSLRLSGANNATLSGSVANPDTYHFTMRVTDATTPDSLTLYAEYTLTVTAPDPLSATANLGKAKVGKAVNIALSDTVSGGVPTYRFAVSESAVMHGFTLTDGVLSGTASATGTLSFDILVTDSLGSVLPVSYSLEVVELDGFTDDDPNEPASGDSINCLTPEGVFSRTCTQITASASTVIWDNSWYYVSGNVTLSAGAIVSNKVSLILCNGATLTVQGANGKAGINVATGNTLTIYAQSVGANVGSLIATGGSAGAGIGGDNKTSDGLISGDCGKVTIYGGVINATGNGDAAGIGGGDWRGNGGTVAIYGGAVTASAGSDIAAGIGKGWNGNNGTLTVGENIVVKSGASANPTVELAHGDGGAITLDGKRYYVTTVSGPVPLAQTTSQFAAYTRESKNWNLADTVSGGTTPYSFALASGSSLPSGFELSGANNATLSCTGRQSPGTYNFTLTVTDAASPDPQVQNFAYTLVVSAPAALSAQSNLGTAKVGKAVNFTLSDTISGGVPPYNFAVTRGESLPTGFELNNGVLSGTATAAGSLSFKITVTDSLYSTRPITYTLEAVEAAGFIEDDPEEPESGVSVDCLTEDGVVRKRLCNTVASSATAVTWNNSWYYVTGNVTLSAGAIVSGKVSLILANGATLTVQQTALGKAGIAVNSGNTLTIYAQSKGASAGKLIATGATDASGIGADYNANCGKINIYGGDITATGSGDGSGVGGGGGSSQGGTVVVQGGHVVATAGKGINSGIGARGIRDQGTLTVADNMVVKAGSAANPSDELVHGAGGAIALSGDKQYFVIEELMPLSQTLNVLEAYLNEAVSLSSLIADTVSGGKKPYSIAFASGELPAGVSSATLAGTPTSVGGPYTFSVTVTDSSPEPQQETFTYTVTVSEKLDGKIQVTFPGEDGNPRTEWCTPITNEVVGNYTVLKTGWYVVAENVTLAKHSFVADGDVKLVLNSGKTLTVTGYGNYSGVRYAGLCVTNDNVLSIYGTGSLVANGGYWSPGIGGDGYGNACGTVKIYGGNITSTGDSSAAGIGGGNKGSSGTVEIYGGTVTATGGSSGAGIGGGSSGNGGTVTIRGGTITATGGDSGAGIGGGSSGNGGTVTIHGGTITATGGQMGGSGIGGGNNGDGANVTIYGGTVTATGDDAYKPTGIGGNFYASSNGTLTTTPNVTIRAGDSANPSEVLPRNASTGEITLQRFKYYTVESETVSGLQLISSALSAHAGKTPTWNLASTISGGTPPYSFALSESSSLPSGLSVSSAGVPSGSAGAGTYNFTFNVTDSAGAEPLAASYTLTVNPFTALAAVSGAGTLGTVAKNGSVNIDFSAKVSGGVQPYSFAVASGSDLPTGLSLNVATGALTGAPTAVGEYAFTITVTDSDSPADSVNIACTLSVKERYTITYYESDGRTKVSGTMPIFYFGGEGAVLGSPFAKTGYIFAGWYANQDLETGGVVTEISASDSGNKVFYAKWTEKSSKMPVSFIGADGSLQEESCTVITSDMSELASGWYVVPENVTMDGSLYINGNVSIVLLDNVNLLSVDRLNDKAGICVTNGNSLTVYGQSKANTGRLIATGTTGAAGIGGVRGQDCGTVTIYGGTVEATGGTGAAGIGGGYNGNGGTVSIYGGTVTATGMGSSMIDGGAGIGGGCNRNGGTVAIYGGTVTATGYANGSRISAGIGGASGYNHGTLTVAADIIVKAGASADPTAEKTRNLETGAITLNGEQYYTAAKGAVQFSITYMSGSSPVELEPSTYTYGVGVAELPNPESVAPAGLTFDGWYDSLGALVTSIGTDATGNITLYAGWKVKTETYKYTDGSGYPHNQTCTAITNGTTELSAGWYIVTDSLTINNTIAVNGAVNLVLKDGKTLTVNGTNNKAGITVLSGNSLAIYGESLGTGALVVTGGGNGAGIGGDSAFGQGSAANGTCGTVTINGGTVTATGGSSGAGIGGGNDGSGGTVVVNGGTVTATGGSSASSGIGCGTPALHSPTHGTLYVDVKLSVKAGSSSNPTENAIRDGLNYVTLSRQRYFVITPPPQYTITYYIDGVVTNLVPAKYAEGSGATLPMGIDLTREGYDFNGWYTNSLCTGEKVTKILSSETGDKEFYAKWDEKAVPLSRTSDTLAAATVGVAYAADLNDTITGGTGPYSFELDYSSDLPHNFIFGSDGEISGTTDIAGTYVLVVRVTDATDAKINAEYTLVVNSDPENPAPSQTASAPTPAYARMNELYEGSIASTVSGGVSFELESGSWLPSGIELAGDGTLSGMVTGLAGAGPFSVIVTGANGSKARLTYTLNVVGVSGSAEYNEKKERTWTYVTYGNGAGGIDGVAIYNDDDCALKFSGASTYDVVIPSKIDGVSVKCIGDFAFWDCTELTGLAIPDGVTSIGLGAFYGCESLKGLTIPDSVTYIGDYAFEDCAPTTVYVAHGKTEFVSNLLAAAECDLTNTEFLEASVVTFDENYNERTPTTRQVAYGAAVGELPVPSRSHATFDGWFTEAVGGTQITASEVITADVTFYAHWTAEKVTVTFMKNDGSGDVVEVRQVNYGEAVGTLPTPTRENYDLVGWYRSDDGSGVPYSASTTVSANISLYARWTLASHTVTFEFNDGTGGSRTRRITHGSAVGELPTDIRRENYELVGWFTAAEGGNEVSAATLVTAPVSFYAHWRGAEVRVSLNANGGTCAESTVTVRYQSAYGELPTPTYDGHTFDGWFTAAEGGTQITAESILDSIRMTLYAHWTEDSATDWPADTSTVEGQTAAEAYGVTGDLATADAKKLADWAKENSVDFGGAIITDAYLLNCANTAAAVEAATETAEEAIKITAITFDSEGNPVLTCPDSYGNGTVVIEGAASLATPMQWHDKTSGDKFFRTVLKP